MSCPNPSAHPVGVRHTRGRTRSCLTDGSELATALARPGPRCDRRRHPLDDRPGRARRQGRPGAGRHPLPPGRAGRGARQRRQARARRPAARPARCSRPTSAARPAPLGGGAQPGPGLHRQPVPGPEPLRGRRGRRLRRPDVVPRPAVDDVGLQRPAGASCSTATPPSSRRSTSAARPPPTRAAQVADDPAAAGRGEGRPSTPSSPRPRTLLDELKAEEREALLCRGAVAAPSDVPASGRAGAAISLRDGPGRRRLRLRRRRRERLRLLRAHHAGLGPGRRRACRTPRAPSTPPARTSPRATCAPATWSSTTARSATSACTSATA